VIVHADAIAVRKRPIVVYAMNFTGRNAADNIVDWIRSCDGEARYHKALPATLDRHAERERICIDTLEGTITASLGDWVIRGTHGEFYPVKPDIFAETYEEIS